VIVDTHRHAYGVRTKQKMVERGLVDPSKPFPQLRDPDVFMYASYWDTESSLQVQREAGVTTALLSGGSQVETLSRSVFQVDALDVIRMTFEDRVALTQEHPGDFAAMIDANPHDARCLKLVEEAIDSGEAKAVSIATSYGTGAERRFLDAPECEWLWEFAEARGVVVHAHPPLVPFGAEYLDRYRLLEAVGRPFDTALSIARAILAGVFDRHPRLQIVAVHMGGALPAVLGRLDFNWRLNYEGIADPPSHKVLRNERPPETYLRTNLYTDTMGFSPTGIRQSVELFGIDRIFLGTDFGPLPFSPREHVDIVRSVLQAPEDQEKVLWRNATRVFGLAANEDLGAHAEPA
jgi:predicted TIM-barrel fold metal-dependent hydrolase